MILLVIVIFYMIVPTRPQFINKKVNKRAFAGFLCLPAKPNGVIYISLLTPIVRAYSYISSGRMHRSREEKFNNSVTRFLPTPVFEKCNTQKPIHLRIKTLPRNVSRRSAIGCAMSLTLDVVAVVVVIVVVPCDPTRNVSSDGTTSATPCESSC